MVVQIGFQRSIKKNEVKLLIVNLDTIIDICMLLGWFSIVLMIVGFFVSKELMDFSIYAFIFILVIAITLMFVDPVVNRFRRVKKIESTYNLFVL